MNINRSQLKEKSRELILTARPKILYASAIVILLSALFSFLSGRLTGVSYEDLMRYTRYVQEGNYYSAASAFSDMTPSAGAQLIDLALQLANVIVSVGFLAFLFNTVRRLGAVYGNLLDGFGPYFRVVLLELVMMIFIFLWSLLFLVPGIIAMYRYRLAPFILLDHPEYSVMECIRLSKQMTAGYKGQLFMLDLSFLGWFLLSMIPYVGYAVAVWLRPYRELCFILFYDELLDHSEAPYTA